MLPFSTKQLTDLVYKNFNAFKNVIQPGFFKATT